MDFDRPGFDREVGLRLQLMRKRRGVTQAVLAEKIGIARPSYTNIEAGRQRVPVDVLWRAAVILGVPISSLVPEPVARTAAVNPHFAPGALFGAATISGGVAAGNGLGVFGTTSMSTTATSFTSMATDGAVTTTSDPSMVEQPPTVRLVHSSKADD
jgi:DNA-binding XRE family transcriptional regulator